MHIYETKGVIVIVTLLYILMYNSIYLFSLILNVVVEFKFCFTINFFYISIHIFLVIFSIVFIF